MHKNASCVLLLHKAYSNLKEEFLNLGIIQHILNLLLIYYSGLLK